jgi:uncharacterized protein YjdB
MRKLIFVAITFFIVLDLNASEIKEVLPLTNKIIRIHFDDGSVTYPNTLNVLRLDVTAAATVASWNITSPDDADFLNPQNPGQVGRKSKGTEFIKDPPWGGSSYNPTSKPWASEHDIYLILNNPLKKGKTYKINSGSLAGNGSEWSFTFDEAQLRSEAVHVNTVGYASDAPKFGYIYQWMGDLGGLTLSDYSSSKFWIYKEGNSTPVKEGAIRKRKSANNAETGQPNDTPDKNFLGAEVYDCDFSDVTEDGTYYLVVEGIGRSYPFKIGNDALFEAYYAVMRGLYHQRSGIRLAPPYSETDYVRPVNQNTKVTSDDGTSFAGKLLYSDFPFTSWAEGDGGGTSQEAIRNAATGKTLDVAGWYHDAGDWDQYYTHERIPIILMLTYELAPERFCDADLNIPESGNGIPDIIDEASWLIKFNYRLRKELKAKGYSNGGVGGARICADVFTSIDGNSETSLPSWKEKRHTIVTQADAFMTYLYAGQSAQFALILKKLGKNPAKFPVEMLDNVDFESMTHDTVDWTKEAEEAFNWASNPENQPAGNTNYSNDLKIYRLYAAVNLFRISGNDTYHAVAKTTLNELKTSSQLSEDQRWGVYSYLIANNQNIDKVLQTELMTVALNTADNTVFNATDKRACRWGGVYDMPMLVGQPTTPWVLEAIVAYELSGNIKYKNAIHTTADYFLGTNPLHTTWVTGVGPRPAACGFHLDSRYNHNWVVYPGFIPYGPWSMAYGYTPFTWTIDGVSIDGGAGPWNKDWANFSQYPAMSEWPGHERWNSNIHAPMASENTIHQNTVFGGLTYGYVNSRQNTNAASARKITSLLLGNGDIIIESQGQDTLLTVKPDNNDATFAALKWKSSDPRIAYVDDFGRVTGVTSGSCSIMVSTLDESVSASCNLTCSWPEVNVEQIKIDPDTLTMVEGQKKNLAVIFSPPDASNKFVNWDFNQVGIVSIDENGTLTALSPGYVLAVATSLNGSRKDTCRINIIKAIDYIIADFDSVIPVTTEPQAEFAQLYTPNGSNDIAFSNPFINDANPSAKVVKWNRPAGDWALIGIVLPLNHPQDLSQYAQFQFKYYGAGVSDFYIQLIADDQSQIEINEPVDGEDCWQLFSYDLSQYKNLVQFNVFANKQGNPPAIPILFDDFVLAGKAQERFDGILISETYLALNSQQSLTLTANAEGHPFSWVSTNPAVASVDQNGTVIAVSGGTALIKAVPLFGNSIECEVVVDGGIPSGITSELIADFETIELNWSGGYGVYAWASDSVAKADNPLKHLDNNSDKTVIWKRDGTNLWGGFGFQFPLHNTSGWDFLSFQVYVTGTVNTIRIEVLNGTEIQGFYQLDNLGIQANNWTTVSFEIADLGIINKDFNIINFQIEGGSAVPMLAYVDNIMQKTAGEIKVTGISINEAGPISKFTTDVAFTLTATVLPADATNKAVDWSSGNSNIVSVGAIVSVGTTGLAQIKNPGTAWIIASSNQNSSVRDSIKIVVSPPSGLISEQNGGIKVYPNPFNETIAVSYMEKVVKIELTNILGSILKEIYVKETGTLTIQTRDIPSGIYLIRFYSQSGYYLTKKIIKK